jgi:restriction endonuclease
MDSTVGTDFTDGTGGTQDTNTTNILNSIKNILKSKATLITVDTDMRYVFHEFIFL